MHIYPNNYLNNRPSVNKSLAFGQINLDKSCDYLPKECLEQLQELRDTNPTFNIKQLLNYENLPQCKQEKIDEIVKELGEDIDVDIFTNGTKRYPADSITVMTPKVYLYSDKNYFKIGKERNGHNIEECNKVNGISVPTKKTLDDIVNRAYSDAVRNMLFHDYEPQNPDKPLCERHSI